MKKIIVFCDGCGEMENSSNSISPVIISVGSSGTAVEDYTPVVADEEKRHDLCEKCTDRLFQSVTRRSRKKNSEAEEK